MNFSCIKLRAKFWSEIKNDKTGVEQFQVLVNKKPQTPLYITFIINTLYQKK